MPSRLMPLPYSPGLQTWLASQFHHLDLLQPARWPIVPCLLLYMGMAALGAALVWQLHLGRCIDELQAGQLQEIALRDSYRGKLAKAAGVEGLKQQREQAQIAATQLEKQLPCKGEMAALLSDITQAGLGRGLQFELFRPGVDVVRDYYAELPITLQLSGRYHDMGVFAADLAQLPRIVTLGEIRITPAAATMEAAATSGEARLVMDATLRTFRALEQEEVAATVAGSKRGGG